MKNSVQHRNQVNVNNVKQYENQHHKTVDRFFLKLRSDVKRLNGFYSFEGFDHIGDAFLMNLDM